MRTAHPPISQIRLDSTFTRSPALWQRYPLRAGNGETGRPQLRRLDRSTEENHHRRVPTTPRHHTVRMAAIGLSGKSGQPQVYIWMDGSNIAADPAHQDAQLSGEPGLVTTARRYRVRAQRGISYW